MNSRNTFTRALARDAVRYHDGRYPVDLPAHRYLPGPLVDALDVLDQALTVRDDFRRSMVDGAEPDRLRELNRDIDRARGHVYEVFREHRAQIHRDATKGRQEAQERLRRLRQELETAATDYVAHATLEQLRRPAPEKGTTIPARWELGEALDGRGDGGLSGAVAIFDQADDQDQGAAA